MAEKEDIHHLADLARLSVTEEERAQQERDFRDVLAFVSDVEKVRATPRPLTATISGVAHVLRDDVATTSVLADTLLDAAPERRGRAVRVPKIL